VPAIEPVRALSRRFPAKRAFITGAGSGLGRALAVELARDGWQLGLVDLAPERLAGAAQEVEAAGAASVSSHALDVASAQSLQAAIGEFVATRGGLDLLVNNAGVAVAGAVEATPVADWRWIVDINLLGVVWGCRGALPVMRGQGNGLILNVASSAGFAAAPHMAAYNASKAAVISVSETLAAELEGSGVQVTVAMPGFFRTDLLASMRAPDAEAQAARQLMKASRHDAAAAAAALLAGAAAGRLYVVWPREYILAWRLKRLFPVWFLRRLQALRRRRLPPADRPPG
jgi:NAD(P)-dependent dehydrogenase (short-subunit alcohol dehydrogenase family)